VPIFFTFGGYQQTVNFGADIQDPNRNFPRAIFTGIGLVIFLYLSINIVYVNVLGFAGVQNAKLLAAELAQSFLGDIGFKITSVAIFISVCGYINASLMSGTRMYHAMADDKVLPEIFKRVNEKTQVQEFALSFFVALIILSFFLLQTFDKILNYIVFMDSIALAVAGGAIFVLRKKERAQDSSYTGFKIRPYPLLPLLFIGCLTWVAYSAFVNDPPNALIGVVLFALGFPLFYLIKKINKKFNYE
jgi:APA family basic amino acid/polyamine antiporter